MCDAGAKRAGICATCGFPMRIEQVFSDRRGASISVVPDRRQVAGGAPAH
jgi:hypothetical protein